MTLKSWCVICIISSPFLDVWFQYIPGSTIKLCYTLTCCYSISPTSCPITCWTAIEFFCEVVGYDRFYSLMLYLQILKWAISISLCRVILMIIYIYSSWVFLLHLRAFGIMLYMYMHIPVYNFHFVHLKPLGCKKNISG